MATSSAVETVHLSSDSDSLHQFDEDFSDPLRRAQVKVLHYKILLPPVSEKRIKKFQSRKEAAANSVAITQALLDLFTRLQVWNYASDAGEESGIKLVTKIESSYRPPPEDDYMHEGEPIWFFRNDLKYLGLEGSLLLSSGLLPEVCAISHIHVKNGQYRLHPSLLAVLTKSLPALRQVTFKLEMPTRRHMFQRREIRCALANAMRDASLDNLEVLEIRLYDAAPTDERFSLDVLTNSDGRDDLSMAIRDMLKLPKLREASFMGGWILAPSAFQTDTSFGPRLERLSFETIPVTPDGKWLVTGNIEDAWENNDRPSSEESLAALDSQDSDATDYIPDHSWLREDGNYPQCFFRYTFDRRTFDPLLLSLAQGVRSMPMLRELTLVTYQGVHLQLGYFARDVRNEDFYRLDNPEISPRYKFEVENIHRPRWVMALIGDEFEFDGVWTFPSSIVTAMEEGGGRILFNADGKVLVSSGDGATFTWVT
ncbi:hypothetical protein K4K54_012526 [Colletotrichum sp. SAR 10_86]|nr:hypothetical protein K4K54_012526 [Colletotrichum sp. SAR 10_86]